MQYHNRFNRKYCKLPGGMHILAPIGFRLPFPGKRVVINIDMRTETSVTVNDILQQAIVAALRGTTLSMGSIL